MCCYTRGKGTKEKERTGGKEQAEGRKGAQKEREREREEAAKIRAEERAKEDHRRMAEKRENTTRKRSKSTGAIQERKSTKLLQTLWMQAHHQFRLHLLADFPVQVHSSLLVQQLQLKLAEVEMIKKYTNKSGQYSSCLKK